MKKYTFLLDAGHGIDTPGKRSPVWSDGTQLLEYEFNRGVVSKIEGLAKKLGINTFNVCPEIEDTSLKTRVKRANSYAAQHPDEQCIYVSVHGNAAGVEAAKGIEVFTSPGQTKSDLIATEFVEALQDSGVDLKLRLDHSDGDPDKESRFYVLIHTSMPAILTENGFFTNEEECKKMMTKQFQYDIAEVHVNMMQKVIEKQI